MSEMKTAAAIAVLAHSIKLDAARKGVAALAKTNWGACAQGDGWAIFGVGQNWDGHRFHGYRRPTLAEVAEQAAPSVFA